MANVSPTPTEAAGPPNPPVHSSKDRMSCVCVLPVLRTTGGHRGVGGCDGPSLGLEPSLQPGGAEYCDPEPRGTRKNGAVPKGHRHVADAPQAAAGTPKSPPHRPLQLCGGHAAPCKPLDTHRVSPDADFTGVFQKTRNVTSIPKQVWLHHETLQPSTWLAASF